MKRRGLFGALFSLPLFGGAAAVSREASVVASVATLKLAPRIRVWRFTRKPGVRWDMIGRALEAVNCWDGKSDLNLVTDENLDVLQLEHRPGDIDVLVSDPRIQIIRKDDGTLTLKTVSSEAV